MSPGYLCWRRRLTFEQEFDHSGTKEISFNVHGIVYVPYAEEETDPLEREVRTLAELLQQVKDEQEYIKIRERVHRNSTVSTIHFLFLGTRADGFVFSRGKHELTGKMVEYLPDRRVGRCLCFSGGISQKVWSLVSCSESLRRQIFRGKTNSLKAEATLIDQNTTRMGRRDAVHNRINASYNFMLLNLSLQLLEYDD